jgi:hypothetical protein
VQRTFPAVMTCAIALGLAAPASAQQIESRIIGTVTDPNGGVLPGVTITATAAQTGAPRTAAGTFGYMLGPLNRTVGLGTARQTQISLRYLF